MTIFAGTIIKHLRKAKHYSQKQLADQLIVSRPTYERYENNKVEIPLSKLCALAQFYQIDPIELIQRVLSCEKALPSGKSHLFIARPPRQQELYG
ncbi:helix-turn-helix transcriptional regulator [Pedobacter sp. Du54]|uniref:helix-turn-helix domain-containing protein n=1 Tax=Pedobacter anseongensis TaxID=3133439 RepID=UPI00309B0BE9